MADVPSMKDSGNTSKEFVPLFGSIIQNKILKMMLSESTLYLSFSVKGLDSGNGERQFREPPSNVFERIEVKPWVWSIIESIRFEGENSFDGAMFFNKHSIPFDFKIKGGTSNPISLFGFGLFDSKEKGNVIFYGPFSAPVVIDSSTPSDLKIPSSMLIGHFGRGNFPISIKDAHENMLITPVQGCPFQKPEECKYYENKDLCAEVRQDKICQKTVRLSGVASPDLSGYGG